MSYRKIILLIFSSSLLFGSISVNSDEAFDEMVKKCALCHGQDGNSTISSMPSIAGMTIEYFEHTMDAYKNGSRKSQSSEMMKNYVHSLSDADVRRLAEFYLKQKYIPREQEFNAAFVEDGKKLHDKYCEKCHEDAGRITENNYGILAGQWIPYLRQSMQDYLDEKRPVSPMMIIKTKAMVEADKDAIEKVIHYYASLK